jgi:hypothetical protein
MKNKQLYLTLIVSAVVFIALAFTFSDIRTLCLSLWNEWATIVSYGLGLVFIALVIISTEQLAKRLKRSIIIPYVVSLIVGAIIYVVVMGAVIDFLASCSLPLA